MKFLNKTALFLAFVSLFFFFSIVWIVSEDLIHVVGRGDTIYSISRFYNVSVDDLIRANNITDASRIQAGTRLRIPVQAAPASQTPQALTEYRVVRGDTLYSIARNNGITLANLLEINRFSPNHVIRAGDVIRVPARTGDTAQNASVPNTPPAQVSRGIYDLRWPITPKEISYMSGEMGVVIDGEIDESVKCIIEGNVISAGPWRKFGRVVIVEAQGGFFYMYGGCQVLSVNVGDRVLPGTELGKLGVNTVSGKPQLFFMVFRNDTPIDPAQAPRAGNGRT